MSFVAELNRRAGPLLSLMSSVAPGRATVWR